MTPAPASADATGAGAADDVACASGCESPARTGSAARLPANGAQIASQRTWRTWEVIKTDRQRCMQPVPEGPTWIWMRAPTKRFATLPPQHSFVFCPAERRPRLYCGHSSLPVAKRSCDWAGKFRLRRTIHAGGRPLVQCPWRKCASMSLKVQRLVQRFWLLLWPESEAAISVRLPATMFIFFLTLGRYVQMRVRHRRPDPVPVRLLACMGSNSVAGSRACCPGTFDTAS
jgi:hypothetical protein